MVACGGVLTAIGLYFHGSGFYDPHDVSIGVRLVVSAVVAGVGLYGALSITWAHRSKNRRD